MALFKVDLQFHEAFVKPIRSLYDEYIVTIDGFKENNAELLKGCWIDIRHGSDGSKIYELFDENSSGELIKENLQEWMCDNRWEITTCISIALNMHERSYLEWFRYVDECSGPDKLVLYCLSRKYGVHSAIYNKSYVWTTLSNRIMLSDTEIYKHCGIRLIYLGLTKYGILRGIKHPSPSGALQTVKPVAEQRPSTAKNRGRKTTCRTGKQNNESKREHITVPVKKSHTLSENRNQHYGITESNPTITTETGRSRCSCRRDIDYLSLNDGLESTTLESTKRRTRTSYPPNRKGPTPGRVAAQCISSPEKSPEAATMGKRNKASALKGIPSNANIETVDVSSPAPSTLTGVQKLSAESLASPSLTGVPSTPDTVTSPNHTTKPTGQGINMENLPDLVLDDTTVSVHVATDIPSTSQAKETFNVEPLSTDDEAEMDVVDALLSLLGVPDDGDDPTLENEQLMPIGRANLPVDTAPVPIALGQVQVDHAIAELAEQDEIQAQAAASKTDADDATGAVESLDNVTTKDETNNTVSKGVFKTTTHTLKKKTENKRSYKCSVCGAKKGSMQLLNEHHKLCHRPQMCGICGCVFDLASSLNHHMYSHDEMRFQCEKCDFRCHFESELLSHNIVHRKTPTHKCMVANCSRWFKRKWELTNHVRTHDETMLKCDTCNFTTKLNKHLKEHKKQHEEDLPYECTICHKRFQYRSGWK